MYETLGDSMRKHRKRARLSQQQVADRMFMERQTLSSWECNRTQPKIDQLALFCQIVGIDLATLLELK